MPLVSKPYNYTNGQTIDANQLDQNLDTLYNLINGLLDAVNIAPSGLNDLNKFANEVITQVKTKGLVYTQDIYGQSWIVLGGVATASGSPANQITVTTLVANILQPDGSYRHITVQGTTYVTSIINATYYLELNPDATMNWSQTHSTQANYMPIATVTSNASGNINVITDNRVTSSGLVYTTTAQNIGGVKTLTSALKFTDANREINALAGALSGLQLKAITGYQIVSAQLDCYLASNAYHDGTNWQRYDTTKPSSLITASSNGVPTFYYAAAGAGTISFTAYNMWTDQNSAASMSASPSFANSKAAQGYQKLPNGLILQWGRIAAPANAATPLTNFPIPFPTAAVSLVGTHTQQGQTCNIYSKSLTNYAFYCTGADGTGAIEWQAMGY